ncbi:anti-sigma factor [Streptomyces sporangiiformans]|uniref:Regulator of SigK n=1 Tax=Streptomyces sporangiiformans TaxID=2315329 RepID=A0A505DB09_9ACTN|nr:anti-sigma factor [Streptomyces sporangiiformans]TPQ18915.1 anti-sigma factor [Streptomyces sporangiiformans]
MTVLFRRRELHSLAAPYALDALEPPEQQRFEKHLRRCDRCAAEVRALREDAVRLAWSTAAPAPAALRDRVLMAVRTTPQEGTAGPTPRPHAAQQLPGAYAAQRLPGARAAQSPRARASRLQGLLSPLAATTAAAALVVAALFGVQASRTQDQLDQERAQAREIAHVLGAPDARATSEGEAGGQGISVVASASQHTAVVTAAGLRRPTNGRVHQLWLMRPEVKPRSLGLFDGDTPLVATDLNTDATSLAVTVEPQGGSLQPTTAPIVQLALKTVGFGE